MKSPAISIALFVALATLFLFASVLLAAPSQASPVVLLKDGKSDCVIVVEPTSSESEKHAAEELRNYFKACTGADLPILSEKPEDDRPMIVLGCGKVAERLGVAPTEEQLGEQGCVIRTVGPNLVIAGTPWRGTLYGVRRFLEKELGVRWYAPGVTKTPKTEDIAVRPTDEIIKPAFLWRKTSYTWPGGDAEFRSRRGENSGGGGKDSALGEGYAFDGTCHSYFRYVSPGEFFGTHPEYFSMINGERIQMETQLCLTNPEVLDIVTERILKRMKERPDFRQYNFSQMDYYNNCQCEKCRAINEKYGTPGGTQYWFVNELAKRTSKVYPDKLIGTLAYMYTEEPPKGMKMHPNVAVWLCHMFPCCDSHPIETCPHDAEYLRRAKAWSKICSHLYIWHYIVDFAHYYNPFPNFRAMAADFKLYKRLGAEGIYAQAMGHGGGGGEFSLLRPYLATELLKDPSQDADAVIRDFLDGYYGAAAEPIWKYITLLHDKVEKENIHMHLYTNPAMGYLPDEVMAKANALFDEAEAAVKNDPEMLERVRVARMPLVYAQSFPRNGYKIEDGVLRFKGPIANLFEVNAFLARMKKHGFRTIREHGGDPNQLIPLTALVSTPMRLVTLENPHLKAEIAPLLGGRMLRIIDKKSGKCATAYNTKRNIMFPFCGGEESRAGGTFTIVQGGSMDPAMPSNVTDRSVTLTADIGLGFKMQREITLDTDHPVIKVKTTLTNPSDKPREAQLRSHLSLELGKVRDTRVRFTDLAGKKVEKDMVPIIAGLREGERYYRENCPAGAWTLIGTDGLEVTQRFDNAAVDFAWLYVYPEYLNELEVELWAKKVMLGPGESTVLENELEVRAK